ncbi:MAG: type II toxin-antitoxin system RelE/ParE family toxin [Nitrospirae bacterium]|nr:type II toxin-antitoxin system RelE/ParE family toxin [Candidatus Troglogloeales bacterium]
MIGTFKHKGLKQLFESSHAAAVNPQHITRLQRILALLETSGTIEDMDLPGLHLHALQGERKGTWSVNVSGNWRVTFRLDNGAVVDVHYEDYH